MKATKETLVKTLSNKFKLDEVIISSIVDTCVKAGYNLGKQDSETEKWKALAERSTQVADKNRNEFISLRKLVSSKFKELDKIYTEFKGVMPNV